MAVGKHIKSTSGRTHRLIMSDMEVTTHYATAPQFDDQVQGELVRKYWREGGRVNPIGVIGGGVATVDPELDAEERPMLPTPGDPHVRWLVVKGVTRVVQRYLYASASLHSVVKDDILTPTHLVVVATSREDVDYLANYQADRLRSGNMGVTVHPTFTAAVDSIRN